MSRLKFFVPSDSTLEQTVVSTINEVIPSEPKNLEKLFYVDYLWLDSCGDRYYVEKETNFTTSLKGKSLVDRLIQALLELPIVQVTKFDGRSGIVINDNLKVVLPEKSYLASKVTQLTDNKFRICLYLEYFRNVPYIEKIDK